MPTSSELIRSALFGAYVAQGREGGVHAARLPPWTRREDGANPMLRTAAAQASGVRLQFDTAATWLQLRLKFTRIALFFVPFPPRPAIVSVEFYGQEQDFAFDEGDVIHVDEAFSEKRVPGETSVLRVDLGGDGKTRRVVVWLPHTSAVEILGLEADAELVPAAETRPRWVHYGSSISHCREADTPLGVWPVIVARSLDLDLYNLGLAGSALLDGFAARTIRDTSADLITLKVGINVVNTGGFRVRTFIPAVHAFLETIREGHPDTPIILVSPIICPAHEDAPGPTEWSDQGQALGSSIARRPMDGALTLTDIRQILESIVAERAVEDRQLSYLDGRELFGLDDLAHLPDGLHPDADGYRLMGERMTALLRPRLQPRRTPPG